MTLLMKYGGLRNLLSKYYPEITWFSIDFSVKIKTQRLLHQFVSDLFPGHDITSNYRSHGLKFQVYFYFLVINGNILLISPVMLIWNLIFGLDL